jgi:transcriptional regulator with XRE-family HTH domain
MSSAAESSTRTRFRTPAMSALRRLRLLAGMSQASLASRAGLSLGWCSVVEREPGLLTVPVAEKLARALNCNPLEIMPSSEE